MQTSIVIVIIAGILPVFRYLLSELLSSSKPVRQTTPSLGPIYFYDCPSGNRIAVTTAGKQTGPDMIMIHGLNTSHEEWLAQLPLLAPHYRIFLIDLPGHGASPTPYTLKVIDLAADLDHLLTVLPTKDPILYGHSLGGMIALSLLTEQPRHHHITALILQHTLSSNPYTHTIARNRLNASPSGFAQRTLRLLLRVAFLVDLLSLLLYYTGITTIFYRWLYFTGKQSAKELRLMVRLAKQTPVAVVTKALLGMADFDLTGQLGAVDCPTLIFGAQKDRLTLYEASVRMSEQIPQSILHSAPEGHMAMMESPDAVNQALTLFLQQFS